MGFGDAVHFGGISGSRFVQLRNAAGFQGVARIEGEIDQCLLQLIRVRLNQERSAAGGNAPILVDLDRVLHLAPDQIHTARLVLLITSVSVALGTACSVFGAVINGFQRYDLNNVAGTASTIVIASHAMIESYKA